MGIPVQVGKSYVTMFCDVLHSMSIIVQQDTLVMVFPWTCWLSFMNRLNILLINNLPNKFL